MCSVCYAHYMDANIYVYIYAHAASHHASGFVCTYIRIYVWRRHLHMYKLIGVYHIPCAIYLYVRSQQKFVVNGGLFRTW